MNGEKAREIVQVGTFKVKLGDRRPEVILDTGVAIGYLEAIEKAGVLVEALKASHEHGELAIQCFVCAALAKWKATK